VDPQAKTMKDKAATAPQRARYLSTGFLALAPRAFGQEFDVKVEPSGDVAAKGFEQVGQVAVIRIQGPLEQHPNRCWQDYETLHAQAAAAFASQARAVALSINSPGGAAAGCFELSRALRAMSLEARKPLGVFIDGMACSAAYALAASATAGIHAPPTSTVASLAVYETMIDQTALDQAMGLRFLFVSSEGADLKLTGNVHIAPSEAQVAHTQAQVNLLTDYFYGLVEEMRGVPLDTIRSLRGATLLATQGADKGLVDVINDWNGFLASLENAKAPKDGKTMSVQAKSKTETEAKEKAPWEEALKTLLSAAEGDDEDQKAKAKRMLKAMMSDDDEPQDDKDKGEAESKRAEAQEEAKKAEAQEEAKKAESEEESKKAKRAEAEEEARKAQARASAGASTDLDLARRVHELEVERVNEKEAAERKALLDSRPDFSPQVRASLEKAAIPFIKDAVKSWPRVTVTPGAAAAAAQPGATPGATDGAQPGIRPEYQALLDRMGKRGPQVAQARVEGTSLVLDNMSSEAAAKRLQELTAQGVRPQGTPHDMARISSTVFRTQPAK
jgi:ClpP class serine protease